METWIPRKFLLDSSGYFSAFFSQLTVELFTLFKKIGSSRLEVAAVESATAVFHRGWTLLLRQMLRVLLSVPRPASMCFRHKCWSGRPATWAVDVLDTPCLSLLRLFYLLLHYLSHQPWPQLPRRDTGTRGKEWIRGLCEWNVLKVLPALWFWFAVFELYSSIWSLP